MVNYNLRNEYRSAIKRRLFFNEDNFLPKEDWKVQSVELQCNVTTDRYLFYLSTKLNAMIVAMIFYLVHFIESRDRKSVV